MQGNAAADFATTEHHQRFTFKVTKTQRFQRAEIAVACTEHSFDPLYDSAVSHIHRVFRLFKKLHAAAGKFNKSLTRVAKGKLTGTIQNQVEIIGNFTALDIFIGHDGNVFFFQQINDFPVARHCRPRCSDDMAHIKVSSASHQRTVFYQRVPENRCCHQDLTSPKRACLHPLI